MSRKDLFARHGPQSDGSLLAYRDLDIALGLTAMAAAALGEGRGAAPTFGTSWWACCAKQCMGGSPATRT